MTDLAAGNTSATAILAREQAHAGQSHVTKFKTLLLVSGVVVFNAMGNLSLAWGMRHIPESMTWNPFGYLGAMLNPYVAAGIILLICWLLARMALLSWADLSFVLPLTGLGYILAAVFGKLFLGESVTPAHWSGTILIVAGTAMVGSTNQQTAARGAVPRYGVAQ